MAHFKKPVNERCSELAGDVHLAIQELVKLVLVLIEDHVLKHLVAVQANVVSLLLCEQLSFSLS